MARSGDQASVPHGDRDWGSDHYRRHGRMMPVDGLERSQNLDVVVASNLFGDILSDLAAAAAGSIGVAPSGNLNPPRQHPSMFEPVHGSAPDIAGRGVANPVGQMWAAAMLLEHPGETDAAETLVAAFEAALASGVRTADLGGTAGTEEFTRAVAERCA